MTTNNDPPDGGGSGTDHEAVDEFARKAGAAIRRPAPPGGLSAIAEQRQASIRRTRLVVGGIAGAVVLVVGALILVNRGDDNSEGPVVDPVLVDTTAAPTTTAAPPTTAVAAAATSTTDAPTTTVAAVSPEVQWALDYVGGTPGPASGEPVRIGYADAGGIPDEVTGIRNAVSLLNAELGGVGGRPVELVVCDLSGADGSRTCADSFGGDPTLVAVVAGPIIGGDFLSVLGTRKPTLISFSSNTNLMVPAGTPIDQAPGFVYQMDGGTGAGIYPRFVATSLSTPPRKVAYLSDLAALMGPSALRLMAGTEVVPVQIDDPSPDAVVAAVRAAGADDADVVMDYGGGCPDYSGLSTAMPNATFVRTELCVSSVGGSQTPSSMGVRDGMIVLTHGYNWAGDDLESGWPTYIDADARYGATSDRMSGASPFATLLTMAKLINSKGGATANPDDLRAAVASFTGPAMFQAGPLACGDLDISPMVCAQYMGAVRYENGKWVDLATPTIGTAIGIDGKIVDLPAT